MPRTQSWPANPYTTPDDPEFEAKVRAQSMAGHAPPLAENARFVKTRFPVGLYGFVPKAEDGATARAVRQVAVDPNVEIVPGKAYGVGVHGATPQTYAHEFRHINQPGAREGYVRLQDAFMAGSPKQWREAVEVWKDYLEVKTLAEARERLLSTLRYNERFFAQDNGMPEPGFFGAFGRPKPVYAPYRHWEDIKFDE